MSAPVNREGRVAIIVTAREYEALAEAHALFAEQIESHQAAGVPVEPHERTSKRALDTLLSKCRDAGIRTTLPERPEPGGFVERGQMSEADEQTWGAR